MVEKIKTNVDNYFWFEKSSISNEKLMENLSENFYSLSKPKQVYLRPSLSSLTFYKFLYFLDINM